MKSGLLILFTFNIKISKTDFLSSDKSPDDEAFRLLLKFLSKYSHVQLFNSDLVDNRQFKKPFKDRALLSC